MVRIRPFACEDVPFGLRLCGQAGWNQTAADWRRFLGLEPGGCFLALWDGKPAGTTTTCIFGPVAWIAMVLVEEGFRGRGIGTLLVRHVLDELDRRGVHTIRLDATPLGQPLYERLGFAAQFTLRRYVGKPIPARPAIGHLPPATESWEEIALLDQAITGTDRRAFLYRLLREHPDDLRVVRDGGALRGFLTARPGTHALQLGPCIADGDAGPSLLRDAAERHAGQEIAIDIPEANEPAIRLAEALGLEVQRELTRMCRGQPLCERIEHLWASSGPEKG